MAPLGLGLSALAVALVLAACSGGSPGPGPVPTVEPPPTATATESPPPSLTPLPSPTPAPLPTVAPLPPAVVTPAEAPQTVYAGVEVTFQVASLKPWERATVAVRNPQGSLGRWPAVRADRSGRATWRRDTSEDATGPWLVQLSGEQGSVARISYVLRDLDLPAEEAKVGDLAFRVYRTPEASFHFDRTVRPATVAAMAELFRDALALVPRSVDFQFQGPIDFFLFADREELRRAVVAAGSSPGEGPLAGISLQGFERPRIYMDVASPYGAPAHILAHEFSHQVTNQIAPGKDIPAWLDEGLAEYHGVLVASRADPVREGTWRRLFRDAVRRAIAGGAWINLTALASRDAWNRESDLERIDLMYGEAYAAADFIARTYGERALRALLDRVAEGGDVDNAMRVLFGIDFEQLQERVRESVVQLDSMEEQARLAAQLARTLAAVAEEEDALAQQWAAFLRQRPGLTRQERLSRLGDMAARYRALAARVETAPVAEGLAEPRELFADGLSFQVRAMESFQRYEERPGAEALAEGNQALERANFLLSVAEDRLSALVNELHLAPQELGRAQP